MALQRIGEDEELHQNSGHSESKEAALARIHGELGKLLGGGEKETDEVIFNPALDALSELRETSQADTSCWILLEQAMKPDLGATQWWIFAALLCQIVHGGIMMVAFSYDLPRSNPINNVTVSEQNNTAYSGGGLTVATTTTTTTSTTTNTTTSLSPAAVVTTAVSVVVEHFSNATINVTLTTQIGLEYEPVYLNPFLYVSVMVWIGAALQVWYVRHSFSFANRRSPLWHQRYLAWPRHAMFLFSFAQAATVLTLLLFDKGFGTVEALPKAFSQTEIYILAVLVLAPMAIATLASAMASIHLIGAHAPIITIYGRIILDSTPLGAHAPIITIYGRIILDSTPLGALTPTADAARVEIRPTHDAEAEDAADGERGFCMECCGSGLASLPTLAVLLFLLEMCVFGAILACFWRATAGRRWQAAWLFLAVCATYTLASQGRYNSDILVQARRRPRSAAWHRRHVLYPLHLMQVPRGVESRVIRPYMVIIGITCIHSI